MEITLERRLRLIGIGYREFLNHERLTDAPLALMTFFSRVKKAYLEDPLENEQHQQEVMKHLDLWMSQTYQKMVALMASTSRSGDSTNARS